MQRYLLGTFLAALAMFVWGAVYWTNPLPYRFLPHSLDDAQAGEALLRFLPANGTYFIPGTQNDPATLQRLHEKGPIATIHFQREGMPPMQAKVFLLGFVHNWICTLLAAFIAVRISPVVLNSYGKRVWFFVLIGTLVAVFSEFSAPIWWGHPWPFHLISALFALTVWLVAGLVLAAFLKADESA